MFIVTILYPYPLTLGGSSKPQGIFPIHLNNSFYYHEILIISLQISPIQINHSHLLLKSNQHQILIEPL